MARVVRGPVPRNAIHYTVVRGPVPRNAVETRRSLLLLNLFVVRGPVPRYAFETGRSLLLRQFIRSARACPALCFRDREVSPTGVLRFG